MISQVKAGALMSYFTLAVNILIGIVYTPWMIQSIGSADYGLFTLAMSVINIFVFDFGLGDAVRRFVAKYLAEGDEDGAQKFLSVTLRLYLLIDIIILSVLIGMFLFIPSIYKGLTPDEIDKFKVIYVVAASFSVISFPLITADGVLSGSEKFFQLKICDFLHKVFVIITMTVCLFKGYGLYALVTVNAVSGILIIVAKWFCIYRYTGFKFRINYWDNKLLRAIVGFSVWVLISAVCQRCVLSIAPSILGVYHSTTEITLFSLALSIEGYYFTFANAINGLFLPRVSNLIARDKEDDILPLMIRVGNIQFFVIGLLFLGLICFGSHFINVWVGPEFSSVYYGMLIMILPSFISLPQNIANTTMIAKNKVRYSAYSNIIKATTNILLAFPLTKYWGAWGMCLSIAISYIVSVIYSNYNFVKILKLDIKEFFSKVFLSKTLPFLFLLIIGYSLNYLIAWESWFTLILKAVIFAVSYSFIMFKFMEEHEKTEFIIPMKRILHIS